MRILFISDNYPPEVNAPATRLYEHAKQWVLDGHEVEVLTSPPNFPEGRVYEGYQNRFSSRIEDGIRVTRVPIYISENSGFLRRTLSFVSFLVSSRWHARRLTLRPDVVVATSPQFFAAIAGYFVGRRFGIPFVLEVRDLWPESIVAVGALKRNAFIRLLERVEVALYRSAARIVVVTDAFKRAIVEKGIEPERIDVLKNGVDLTYWAQPLDPERLWALRRAHGLEDAFVASYIGTIGMAHRVDIMLDAARHCPEVVFLIAGAGAERAALEARLARHPQPNVRLLGKVPRDDVRYLLALSNVSVVHLKGLPLFRTVIPSKLFEAMAARIPIALGVEGEARDIVEQAGAGLPFEPENCEELVRVLLRLKSDPARCSDLAEYGSRYVRQHGDRVVLARRYAAILDEVAVARRPGAHAGQETR